MARRTALTNESLVALGADKLARLVLDEAGRDPSFKKRVTAALAGAQGPGAVAAIVDRRLAGLERARGFVDWEKRKDFAADLRATLATITTELGGADPGAAVDRVVRFLACAGQVFERVDDPSGHIQAIFHDAVEAVPALTAGMPEEDRLGLVERLIPALASDEHGLLEAVVLGAVPRLQPDGLAALDAEVVAVIGPSARTRSDAPRDWARLAARDRLIRVRQAIADARNDVDGFIALESKRPDGRQDSLEIAGRLLAAGRAAEALDWVRRPVGRGLRVMTMEDLADGSPGMDHHDRERVLLEIRVLMALGRKDEAQTLRWQTFEAALDPAVLRDYVAHLGDFEEFDVLARAFALAAAHPHRYRALGLLLAWPRLDLAATLVLDHRGTWAGRHYDVLLPAAEALEHGHPQAATVLYRALLDDILARARSPAYGHAARYLARLGDLAAQLARTADPVDHETYRAGLRRSHGRKAGFWSLVDGAT